MAIAALLALMLCSVGSATLTQCTSVASANQNLAYYITNFTSASTGCQIDDKVFYGFSASVTGITTANVGVTPVTTAFNPGFTFNPNMSVGGNTGVSIQDLGLHFTVAVLPGGNLIEDDSLGISGVSFQGTGNVKVGETVCAGTTFTTGNPPSGGCPSADTYQLNVIDPGNPTVLFDIKFTPLVSLVDVFKDVSVQAGTNGNAALSSFSQQFSEVPEVSSILLLGTSFLLTSIAIRRKRAKQS